MHPAAAAAAAAAGAYQRNSGMMQRDAVLGLHPEILGRYPPELTHHVCVLFRCIVAVRILSWTFLQLQRQMLMDRERFSHSGAGGPMLGPHPSFLAQQEEYLRYINSLPQK